VTRRPKPARRAVDVAPDRTESGRTSERVSVLPRIQENADDSRVTSPARPTKSATIRGALVARADLTTGGEATWSAGRASGPSPGVGATWFRVTTCKRTRNSTSTPGGPRPPFSDARLQ